MFRPNRVGDSKPWVGSTLLSHAGLQTQSRLCMSSTTTIRSLATPNGPYQVHLATNVHRLYTQQYRGRNSWSKWYPDVHDIQMKNIDKNAVWGDKFEAIITVHREKDRRARRVWTPFSGGSQRPKALKVKWPEDEQAEVQRKLRDAREKWGEKWKWFGDDEDDEEFYMVTEKVDADGRLFWREVIPEGEDTAEEDHLAWEEMMEEEGFNAEIERQMRKGRG